VPPEENTVTIERPVEDVFAFLADGTNNPRWRPGVLDVTPLAGGPAVGITKMMKDEVANLANLKAQLES